MASEAKYEYENQIRVFKYTGRFDLDDLEDLWEEMSDGDKDYLRNRCIPGIERFRRLDASAKLLPGADLTIKKEKRNKL